jgi:hypothetical protein
MPVYMFDKEGNFQVLTVEQVSLHFFAPLRHCGTSYCLPMVSSCRAGGADACAVDSAGAVYLSAMLMR